MSLLTPQEKSKLKKKKLYKILNDKENHNYFQYHEGLNVDTQPFNPKGSCEPGGLYFSDVEQILEFLDYGPYIREVTIPARVPVYQDPDGNKYKAHQIILGSRREWKDCIIDLINEGANIHAYDDFALRYASSNGHVDLVKILLEHGADVHADNDSALRNASGGGHVEVVKILLEHGADVHASNDSALKYASENGHIEVVKLLTAAKGNTNGNS